MAKKPTGGARKRRADVPDDPWPVGSLCINKIGLEMHDYPEHFKKESAFGCLRRIRPTTDRRVIQVYEAPFIYLGLARRPGDDFARTGHHHGNVEIVFYSQWGLVSWFPGFYYDGHVSSIDAFKSHVWSAFKCTSRYDTAVG